LIPTPPTSPRGDSISDRGFALVVAVDGRELANRITDLERGRISPERFALAAANCVRIEP